MATFNKQLVQTTRDAVPLAGLFRLVSRRATSPVGVFFTLRQVTSEPVNAQDPLRAVKLSTGQLETAIEQIMRADFDIVSLDEAHYRLCEGDFERRFACFVVEDGYRDTLALAHPVLRRAGAPYAIAVASDITEGRGRFWWLGLGHILQAVDKLSYQLDGERRDVVTATPAERLAAYEDIYRVLSGWPRAEAFAFVRDVGRAMSFDPADMGLDLALDWEDLAFLADDPLVTIAVQPCDALGIADDTLAQTIARIERSRTAVYRQLGVEPFHFVHPSLNTSAPAERDAQIVRELGFKLALGVEEGLIYATTSDRWTLPRIYLTPEVAEASNLDLLLSGAPQALVSRMSGETAPWSS